MGRSISDGPVEQDETAKIEQLSQSLYNHQVELQVQQEELERTSLQLEQSRQKFDQLRDNASVAYLTHDRDGFVFEANKRARQLLGLQPCQSDFSLHSVLCSQARELFDFHIRRVKSTRSPASIEFRLTCGGLKEVFVLAETSILEKDVYQTVMVDISRQKESELVQEKLDNHLVHSQKMEILNQLSGGVAHDFNNILQVMVLQADLAMGKTNPNDEGAISAINEIRKTAERGVELTRRLLAFSRKQPLEKVRGDLNEILRDSMDLLEQSTGENWKIILDQQEERLGVWVDRVQVEQVIMNLCMNARDAMPDGGMIEINSSKVFINKKVVKSDLELRPGNYAVITVTDEGNGIPQETLARIFEPFYTTKPVGKGTGLGMSIVHSIARQHKGAVEINSTSERGTTISFYLPSFQLPAIATDNDDRVASETNPTNNFEGTVLICDDEPTILQVLSYSLENLGLNVLKAENGTEAYQAIAESDSIDLLLTDVVLPEGDGREICRRYREKFPTGAVVLMSGHGDSVLCEDFLLETDATFLPKPFKLANLHARLGLNLIS